MRPLSVRSESLHLRGQSAPERCMMIRRILTSVVFLCAAPACLEKSASKKPLAQEERVPLDEKGACYMQIIPLDIGICRVIERSVPQDRKALTRFSMARCGEFTRACGRSIECDCSAPVSAHPCEPERKEFWPYEDGQLYDDRELSMVKADAGLERLRPQSISVEMEGQSCAIFLSPPEYGYCALGGAIFLDEGVVHPEGKVPLGEAREFCGVSLRCECSEFPRLLDDGGGGGVEDDGPEIDGGN
jgi:hypothetical protein